MEFSVEYEHVEPQEDLNSSAMNVTMQDMPSLLMASPLKFILPKDTQEPEESPKVDAAQPRPMTPPPLPAIPDSPLPVPVTLPVPTTLPVPPATVQQPPQPQPKSARKTKQQKEAELALQVSIIESSISNLSVFC